MLKNLLVIIPLWAIFFAAFMTFKTWEAKTVTKLLHAFGWACGAGITVVAVFFAIVTFFP